MNTKDPARQAAELEATIARLKADLARCQEQAAKCQEMLDEMRAKEAHPDSD